MYTRLLGTWHIVVYLFFNLCSFATRAGCGWDESQEEKPLPRSAQVVICGGGVIGASVAYHLPKCGFDDVILLEQGRCVQVHYVPYI